MKDVHDMSYYGKCMIGGILSCGLTHTALTPLDLIKCRIQCDPNLYKGIGDGFKTIIRTRGFNGLTVGWLPTGIGYSMQGFGKFGFYEMFKDLYVGIVGPDRALKYRAGIWLAASASAEFFADMFLCPMESLKVRMQTSEEGTFTRKLVKGVKTIWGGERLFGFYKGLPPLWMRQIPYTMVKFACFEKVVLMFYARIFTKPKQSYSKFTQLSITFTSGYIAGVFCALVSHPSDTIVSKLYQRYIIIYIYIYIHIYKYIV